MSEDFGAATRHGYDPRLTRESTYVCDGVEDARGCGELFGSYEAAKEHVENCPKAGDLDG